MRVTVKRGDAEVYGWKRYAYMAGGIMAVLVMLAGRAVMWALPVVGALYLLGFV